MSPTASNGRQQLLLSELTHRVKNTLAVVQSIARETMRTTSSSAGFIDVFEGRLMALASSHKLLVESNWDGAELGDLARSQLDAYVNSNPQRLRMDGEPVTLPPDIATPFGLVLHELATNAAKYGSLSAEGGRVLLSWKLGTGNGEQRLTLVWKEFGGPPVEPPKRQGLGNILIGNGLPGATVHRDFSREGLICTIELDLSNIQQNRAAT